jgi:hypothetical protein
LLPLLLLLLALTTSCLQWYSEVYPHLEPHQRPYEFTQHPGEIVFIPGGWWHLVLNLEPSVAITENFVSPANLDRVVAQSALGSRAYQADVLRFYEPQQRPWLAAWQQHQLQQWQVWQQQQQQLGSGCCDTDDSMTAALLGAAQMMLAAAAATAGDEGAAERTAAAAAAAAVGRVITCNVQPSKIACGSSSSSSAGGSAAVLQPVLEADIYCRAAGTHSLKQQQQQEPFEQDHHPWSGLLAAVAGGRGYRGSRLLGPLMKALWQQQQQQQRNEQQPEQQQQQQQQNEQQPEQQQQQQRLPLADIANRWLAQQEWQQLLGCICEAHGVCSPHELHSGNLGENLGENLVFPECGCDSLVFTVKNAAVKFLVGQPGLPGELAAALEADALWQLQQQHQQQGWRLVMSKSQQQQQQQQQDSSAVSAPMLTTPQLLGHGTVHFELKVDEAANGMSTNSCICPYLVLSRVEGQGTAASLNHKLSQLQRQQLAVSCGQLLAALHSLPLQQGVATCNSSNSSSSSSSDNEVQLGCTSEAVQLADVRRAGSHQQQQRERASSTGSSSSSNSKEPTDVMCPGSQQQQWPADTAASGCSSRAALQLQLQQLLCGSFWRTRDGTIWSSQLGRITQQQQQQEVVQAAVAQPEPTTAAAAVLDKQQQQQAVALWQPFLQFLQQRRADVLQQLQEQQQALLQQGTAAAEILARFPAAADALAAAQQQQQQVHNATASGSSSQASSKDERTGAAAMPFPCVGVGEDCLPSWLLQQLPSYIPQDISRIVAGAAACNSKSPAAADAATGDVAGGGGPAAAWLPPPVRLESSDTAAAGSDSAAAFAIAVAAAAAVAASLPPPVRLHGDLMAGNLVLQLPQQDDREKANMNSCLQDQQQQHEAGSAAATVQRSEHAPGASALQQQQQQLLLQQVSFIDFADGGIGDPLFDFVAVFVSVLDCDVQLLQLALDSYAAHADVAAMWPARPVSESAAPGGDDEHDASACRGTDKQNGCGGAAAAAATACTTAGGSRSTNEGGGNTSSSSSASPRVSCSVSHAFMVYLLLHEEGGVAGQLLQQQPQLKCCSSLQEVQQQLFGWMDSWWASCMQQAAGITCTAGAVRAARKAVASTLLLLLPGRCTCKVLGRWVSDYVSP